MAQGEQNRPGILLETGTNEVEFLEFCVERQRFAANVAKIRQTVLLRDFKVTRGPCANEIVRGTVQFRGHPTPVIDLRTYLELGGEPNDPARQLLIVMEFNNKTMAFIVDSVEGIHRMSWDQFEPLSSTQLYGGEACATGTITIAEHVIIILDLEAMMASLDPSMRIENYAPTVPAIPSFDRATVRIVYAEDSALIQKVTLKTLREAGFAHVSVFSTGAQALSYVKSTLSQPADIIISDIEMPEMDGLSFCKNVKSLAEYAKVPFIFFSSLVSEEMRRKCNSLGADGSYSKPQINELVDAMERIWKDRQSVK